MLLCLNSKPPSIPFSVPFLKYLPPEEELNHHTDLWQRPRERIASKSTARETVLPDWTDSQCRCHTWTRTPHTIFPIIAILFFSQQMVEFKMKSEYLCEVILRGVILLYWNPIVGYILHLWNLIFFLSVTTIPYGMVVNKKYQKYFFS